MAVGGTAALVGGTSVAVGGTGVSAAGIGALVAGIEVGAQLVSKLNKMTNRVNRLIFFMIFPFFAGYGAGRQAGVQF